MTIPSDWLVWALLSAVFAAFTAILAKVGLEGIDSDFATLVRTFVIAAVLSALGEPERANGRTPSQDPGGVRCCS